MRLKIRNKIYHWRNLFRSCQRGAFYSSSSWLFSTAAWESSLKGSATVRWLLSWLIPPLMRSNPKNSSNWWTSVVDPILLFQVGSGSSWVAGEWAVMCACNEIRINFPLANFSRFVRYFFYNEKENRTNRKHENELKEYYREKENKISFPLRRHGLEKKTFLFFSSFFTLWFADENWN